MLKYIAKRILIFIPTLLAISLLAFIISISAPTDPVEKLSNSSDKEGAANQQSNASKKTKQDLRKKLGLDLPVFYFSFGSISDSDTLYKVADKDHSATLSELSHYYGNWEDVSDYFNQMSKTQTSHFSLDLEDIFKMNIDQDSIPLYSKNEINDVITQSNFEINAMLETANPSVLESKFNSLADLYAKYGFLSGVKKEFDLAKSSYETMLSQQSSWKSYVPKIIWYGSKNQYHFWLFGDGENRKGVVRGDFGYSYIDSQPINTKIWSKVWISFSFSILSVLFAYIISIPLGIYSAYKKDSKFDRISSIIVFVLYSMPGFFIGVLLIYTFANPDTLRWFPVSGIQDPTLFNPNWSFWEKTAHRAPYFILPLITYTYSSFAFLSRIMRVGVIDVFGQDYIRTARAKGLGEGKVVMKHALRNSLLPIITVFANIFPLAIGGSVIIETIFTIPGMGFEIYNSILNSDYPMIVAVFTIIGFLTMIGYLVADVLYAVVDPRISYK
ncbi:MAG: ABC transporter permease [Flavobacteriales bacterium]|nr:ABC transporter permease [Flavobacteriales bacterium]